MDQYLKVISCRLLQLKFGSQYCTAIKGLDFTVRTTSDVDVARLLLLGATSAVVTLETLSPSISDTFTTSLIITDAPHELLLRILWLHLSL